MNPSHNELPGMQLPAPMAESAPVPATAPGVSGAGMEQAAATGPEMGVNPQPQAMMPAPVMPLPIPPTPATASQPQPANDDKSTSSFSISSVVNDSDLIEKEWVNKAKAIVEKTKDDPYKQSEELTVFKADYMKQHYNKSIKLNK
jgi:hypothetical protein